VKKKRPFLAHESKNFHDVPRINKKKTIMLGIDSSNSGLKEIQKLEKFAGILAWAESGRS